MLTIISILDGITFKWPSAKTCLAHFFLFFVFFPYLKILINTGTDTQPWALLTALALLFLFRFRINKSELMLGLLFISALSLLLLFGPDYNAIKPLGNIFSLFVCAYVTRKIFEANLVSFRRFLIVALAIWICVGAIQTFFVPQFLTFFICDYRTSLDRGAVSLAPEPTFFGTVLLFFILFLRKANMTRNRQWITLCVAAIVILAKSSMAILYLVLFFFIFNLRQWKMTAVLVFFLSLGVFALQNIDLSGSGVRFYHLLGLFIDDPVGILLLDASINQRFFHFFYSFYGAFTNYFIPHGFSAWSSYAHQQLAESYYFSSEWNDPGEQIMSGLGNVFFQLGLPAVFLLASIFFPLRRLYRRDKFLIVQDVFSICIVMSSALPIGFPMFAFYIGYLNYLANISCNGNGSPSNQAGPTPMLKSASEAARPPQPVTPWDETRT